MCAHVRVRLFFLSLSLCRREHARARGRLYRRQHSTRRDVAGPCRLDAYCVRMGLPSLSSGHGLPSCVRESVRVQIRGGVNNKDLHVRGYAWLQLTACTRKRTRMRVRMHTRLCMHAHLIHGCRVPVFVRQLLKHLLRPRMALHQGPLEWASEIVLDCGGVERG